MSKTLLDGDARARTRVALGRLGWLARALWHLRQRLFEDCAFGAARRPLPIQSPVLADRVDDHRWRSAEVADGEHASCEDADADDLTVVLHRPPHEVGFFHLDDIDDPFVGPAVRIGSLARVRANEIAPRTRGFGSSAHLTDDAEDDKTREDSSYHCSSVNFSAGDRLSVDTLRRSPTSGSKSHATTASIMARLS